MRNKYGYILQVAIRLHPSFWCVIPVWFERTGIGAVAAILEIGALPNLVVHRMVMDAHE